MKLLRFHRGRMIAATLCTAVVSLCGGITAQAQNNIFPLSGSAGIGTINPLAPLQIHSQNGFPLYPSLLFTYGVDAGGEIGVANVNGMPSSLVQTGDYFLRTTARTNHMVLTAQTPGGQIKFGTTVANGQTPLEREAMTISAVQDAQSAKGHTQIDVKTAAPNDGNAVIRFYNSPNAMVGDKGPWIMGLDAHHSLHVTHNGTPGRVSPDPVFRIGLNKTPSLPTFPNNNDNYLTILRDGRVILGKPLSFASGLFDSRLSVDGRIVANELVCVGIENWADFVFADDYRLPTLDEVEKHIQQHRHLPDIPSAGEVQQKGVNVVEMQTKLLQKVEELTLYVIDQNKQLSEQNKQLLEQSERIRSLEAELERTRRQEQSHPGGDNQ